MFSNLPTLSLCSRKQELISRIVESFKVLAFQDTEDTQHSATPFVCKLHDEILQLLSKDVGETDKRFSAYILRLRLLTMADEAAQIHEYVTLEADLYRAASLTSLYLMKHIPTATNQPLSPGVEEALRSSFQRSQILLQTVGRIQSQCCSQDGAVQSPTKHPILDGWICKLNPPRKDYNLVSFDREALKTEEDELLQMATTPIPQENKSSIYHKLLTNHIGSSGLTARLWLDENAAACDSSSTTPIYVFWNDRGVLRSKDAERAWWLVTCDSSISFHTPNLHITAVITNTPKFSTIPSLTLEIGKDEGALWWEELSKMVLKLQEVKELQDELTSLWTCAEIERNLTVARTSVAAEPTVLN